MSRKMLVPCRRRGVDPLFLCAFSLVGCTDRRIRCCLSGVATVQWHRWFEGGERGGNGSAAATATADGYPRSCATFKMPIDRPTDHDWDGVAWHSHSHWPR